MISATLYSDPACPWAYSESPALRVIEWRYGDQLDWRLVLVGLTEEASQYEARGYTPIRGALGQALFRRRYGMPFSPAPKARLSATSRACRAVVAARLTQPGSEWRVFRAIQLANFNTPLILDDDANLADALRGIPGIDADQLVALIDSPEIVEAYHADKDETRKAAGSAAELQGKTATTDGPVRFTAPSIVFEQNGTHARRRRLPAGRGLRHPGREHRPEGSPRAAARGAGAAARAIRRRPHDSGSRGVAGREQRSARPRRRRGGAARAGRHGRRGASSARRRRRVAVGHGLRADGLRCGSRARRQLT